MLTLAKYKRELYVRKALLKLMPSIIFGTCCIILSLLVKHKGAAISSNTLVEVFGTAYLIIFFSLGFLKSMRRNLNSKKYKEFLITLPRGKQPFGNIDWEALDIVNFILLGSLPYFFFGVPLKLSMIYAFLALAWGYAIVGVFYLKKEFFWGSIIVTILLMGRTINLEFYSLCMLGLMIMIHKRVKTGDYTSWLKIELRNSQNLILPLNMKLDKVSTKEDYLWLGVFCAVYSYISIKLIPLLVIEESKLLLIPLLISSLSFIPFVVKTYPMNLWGRIRNKVFWDWEYDKVYLAPFGRFTFAVVAWKVYPYLPIEFSYYFCIVSCIMFVFGLQVLQGVEKWWLTGKHRGDMAELRRRDNI